MGAATSPQHFVGLRTQASWTRDGVGNFWRTGWELVDSSSRYTDICASGDGATLRVAEPTDDGATAWYFRIERDGGQLVVTAFLPDGDDTPSQLDFETQMYRDVWKRSVNRHSTYRETVLRVDNKEGILGELDSMNLFSNIRYAPSEQLRGIEFLAAMVLRLS